MSFEKQFGLKSKPAISTVTTNIISKNNINLSELKSPSSSNNTSFTSEVNSQDINGVFINTKDNQNDQNLINLLGQLDTQNSEKPDSRGTIDPIQVKPEADIKEDAPANNENTIDSSSIKSEVPEKSNENDKTSVIADVKETENRTIEQEDSIEDKQPILDENRDSANETEKDSVPEAEEMPSCPNNKIAALIEEPPSANNLNITKTDTTENTGSIVGSIEHMSISGQHSPAPSVKDQEFDEKTGFDNDDREAIKTDNQIQPSTTQNISDSSDPSLVQSSKARKEAPKPFDFKQFLGYLKNRKADPVVRYIRSFLTSFSKKTWSVEEQIKLTVDFKSFIYEKFLQYDPFSNLSPPDFENAKEGLEKLIMNKLYAQCFSPQIHENNLDSTHRQDLFKDKRLSENMRKFSWVEGKHLDIEESLLDSHFLKMSTAELSKINNYRAPRDKVVCLLNCCKIIFGVLKQLDKETNADSFIPLLIYIILKSNVQNLISNLLYIERFRNEEHLNGETGYYLSSLQGAISFIEELNINSLSVSEEEYNEHIEKYEELIIKEKEERNRKEIESPNPQHMNNPQLNDQPSVSPSSVLLSSAGLLKNSISNLLSPPPQNSNEEFSQTKRGESPNLIDLDSNDNMNTPIDMHNERQLNETYDTLKQMFPNLDKGVIKDIISFQSGNIGNCIDICLDLVNEV